MSGYNPLIQPEIPHKSTLFGKSTRGVLGVFRKLGWPQYVILAVVFFVVMCFLADEEEGERVHITCLTNQPLVRVFPNFLPEETFRTMHQELPHHPLIGQNPLDEDNFNGSTGFLVKFNLEGLPRLKAHELFDNLVPYVESVLNEHSNAFVFNLLVSAPTQPGKFAVGMHLDDTVALYGNDEMHLAHQVNVLYTNLPKGMQGGELEAWNMKYEEAASGKAVVTPMENTMVEFRGDAYHRVRGFSSQSRTPRISLVFEQYRISPDEYSKTIAYCENQQCADLEGLSPDQLLNMS